MIKVYLANDSKQSLGGGWTFLRNIRKGLIKLNHQIVDRIEDCDVFLIPGATMVNRKTVERAKELKKKIVTRCDNIPRNSRNRNTGTSRLRDFTLLADKVVYQSEWAKEYIMPFINREGPVVYNGVDIDIFKKAGLRMGFRGSPTYLYSRFNRDETKRWEEAWYEYQMIQRRNPKAKLVIVGNFSPEQVEYNFDFFMGENYEYLGVIESPEEMARIYRSCDYFLATYYNDCYSNTYCEAIACGCQLYRPNLSGGTAEVIEQGVIKLEDMTKEYVEIFEELLK